VGVIIIREMVGTSPRSWSDAARQAVVPFAPRNDRPVYCSTCFDKVRAAAQPATV